MVIEAFRYTRPSYEVFSDVPRLNEYYHNVIAWLYAATHVMFFKKYIGG